MQGAGQSRNAVGQVKARSVPTRDGISSKEVILGEAAGRPDLPSRVCSAANSSIHQVESLRRLDQSTRTMRILENGDGCKKEQNARSALNQHPWAKRAAAAGKPPHTRSQKQLAHKKQRTQRSQPSIHNISNSSRTLSHSQRSLRAQKKRRMPTDTSHERLRNKSIDSHSQLITVQSRSRRSSEPRISEPPAQLPPAQSLHLEYAS